MTSLDVEPSTASIDRVVLEVPATTDHLRMIRLLVSALATAHGADLNDLEDLRIASGELCAHLINEAPDGARMTVTAEVFGSEGSLPPYLLLRAVVPDGDHTVGLDDISSMVLTAASDVFGVGPYPGLSPGEVSGDLDMSDTEPVSSAWFRRHVRAVASA